MYTMRSRYKPLRVLRVAARGARERAVAGHYCRDAVLEARPSRAVPAKLRVIVRVDVDQARREHLAPAVELPRRCPAEIAADAEYPAVLDRNVAHRARALARAIDHERTTHYEVCCRASCCKLGVSARQVATHAVLAGVQSRTMRARQGGTIEVVVCTGQCAFYTHTTVQLLPSPATVPVAGR